MKSKNKPDMADGVVWFEPRPGLRSDGKVVPVSVRCSASRDAVTKMARYTDSGRSQPTESMSDDELFGEFCAVHWTQADSDALAGESPLFP